MEPTIAAQGPGSYAVTATSVDGPVVITLLLDGIEDASDGRLADDDATAAAVVGYLLEHQDAVDLPSIVEFEQVAAAYPDAVDAIARLRG